MTPLHWAAYNDDPGVVKFLLSKGAQLQFNSQDLSPVDIAGLCNNEDIVYVFAKWLEAQVGKEMLSNNNVTPEMPTNPLVPEDATKNSQVKPMGGLNIQGGLLGLGE